MLFPSGRMPKTTVVSSLGDFQSQLRDRSISAKLKFDQLGAERHAALDMVLTSKIEDLYTPILGPWEPDDAPWFHNMDFYGDGVRGLGFTWDRFPLSTLATLQEYLTGDHEGFSVLIWFNRDSARSDSEPFGALWMTSKEMLVTKEIVEKLTLAA